MRSSTWHRAYSGGTCHGLAVGLMFWGADGVDRGEGFGWLRIGLAIVLMILPLVFDPVSAKK